MYWLQVLLQALELEMGIASLYSRAQCPGTRPTLKVLGNLSREHEIDGEIELAQQTMGMPTWKKVKTYWIIACVWFTILFLWRDTMT